VNFLLCSASWVFILVTRRGEKLHLDSRALSWLETGENAAARARKGSIRSKGKKKNRGEVFPFSFVRSSATSKKERKRKEKTQNCSTPNTSVYQFAIFYISALANSLPALSASLSSAKKRRFQQRRRRNRD